MRAAIRRLFIVGTIAVLTIIVGSSIWTQWQSSGRIGGEAKRDWVIVLGDRVNRDGTPSVYLRDRLKVALSVVQSGRADRVLISGHAGSSKGNEVGAMRDYLEQRGLAPSDITDDKFGVTTYDTCARARKVFKINSAILVTQDFHLRRAVALCRDNGIDAVGAEASTDAGVYLTVRNWFREIALSRPKAALDALLDPAPRTLSR